SDLQANFGIEEDTSKSMILVPLLNPTFATVPAEKSCELRVRGTSRLLKFVFEGGRCATLIQDRALRRMKDSARPGPGFENFASFASIGVFQQPARADSRDWPRSRWRGA